MSPSTRRKSLPYDLGSERLRAAVAIVAVGSIVPSVQAQISADQVSQIRSANQARVEALTIWGSDYGFSDGIFDTRGGLQQSPSAEVHSELVKLGGSGEIGDPQPVAGAPIGWQPRLQGNMGYLESETNLQPEPLKGDRSRVTTYGIEFGGGVRFWMSQAFSVAPTLMGIYGSTSEDYTDRSAFAQMHLAQLVGLGLIDWHVDTWTLRPALNLQYLILIDRTIITLSTDSTYFHTESFSSSHAKFHVEGDSESVAATVDVDVPLGIQAQGHELRTGGFISYTALGGGLREGLNVQGMNEIHGRLVFDALNQVWKLQWIGIGVSYIVGHNITGWTVDADFAFRF